MNIKLKRETKKKNRKHYYLVCIHVLITRFVKWAWLLTLPGHAYFCGVARELSQRRPSVMGFLESVEEEYATRDLYRVLGLTKDCSESEIRRAYHKLSLKVHPDRVDPESIEESTKKFQVRPLDTISCYTVGNNFVLFLLQFHLNVLSHCCGCGLSPTQILSKIYSILSDAEKRSLYDETGIIPKEDSCNPSDINWIDAWKLLFKKVTIDVRTCGCGLNCHCDI